MIHVILLILKTAGILLLSLLGLVLLLVCAVLFVPVTYRVQAEKEDSARIHAAVCWMFRMLSVHYRLEGNKQDLELRLFGIPIYRPWAEKKPDRKRKKKKTEKKPKRKKTKEEKPKQEKSKKETSTELVEERRDNPGDLPAPVPAPERTESRSEAERQDGTRKKKESFFRRAAYAIRTFCDRIKRIWEMCRLIPKKIRSMLDRKDQLLEFWDMEEHRRARAAVWKEFLYLRDKIRPKKIRGYIHFGFEDPSMTGICMGAASVLYAWYPEQFELRPDFERTVLEGKIFFRGNLRLYALVLSALRIWFNQDIRLMYEHWKEL